VSDAWMPAVRYVRAAGDGGPLKGGAPRVVWGVIGADPRTVSARSAAQRLDQAGHPCHLVWNPLHGEIIQLIPVVRAARSLCAPLEPVGRYGQPRPAAIAEVNSEGRVGVQIRVVAFAQDPFTNGPLARLQEILAWLDSWGVSRNWPAGQPEPFPERHLTVSSRRLWARGGHFGESQVPGVHAAGPGAIDIERLTGWSAGHAAPAPGPAGIGPGARQPAARRSHRDNYEPAALGDLLGDQVAQAASLARVR
jgi:hypothetical protein